MGARDVGGLLAPIVGLLLGLYGCSSAPPPSPQPPADQAAAAAPVPAVAPQTVTPMAPAPPGEEPVAIPTRDAREIVIESGGGQEAAAPGLVAAARAERERRQGAAPPMLVIDDKNLGQHATGGLTISSTAPVVEAPGTVSDAPDEQRWRQRVRTLREHWALSVEAIQELDQRSASLRTRFYAADDPYVRDGQIKPAWDHALENLAAARRRAREIELELAATLEEGRRAGALPGWLREGLELEPTDYPYERPDRAEPVEGELSGEPVIFDGSGGQPQ